MTCPQLPVQPRSQGLSSPHPKCLRDERPWERGCSLSGSEYIKPVHLTQAANRLRQTKRPADPTGLDFELREDLLPDRFLGSDIRTRQVTT